jgi:peptidyl-prolyl cis-trans isomerase SurA
MVYKNLIYLAYLFGVGCVCLTSSTGALAQTTGGGQTGKSQGEVVVEMVVARVDDQPIMLSDLEKRLRPPRKLSPATISTDPEARTVLDQLIMERLIRKEAEARRVELGADEVERYIDEVAKRNGLSRDGFEKALAAEGRSLSDYKDQIGTEILKSRLIANLIKNSITVSEEEVDRFIEERPELSGDEVKIKLRMVQFKADEEADKKVELVRSRVAAGESFSDIALEISEAENSADGGLLGLISERDLASEIFDVVFSLKPGEVSKPVKGPNDVKVFFVEERISPENQGDRLREEAKEAIRRQKAQNIAQDFLYEDLVKRHYVEKKI